MILSAETTYAQEFSDLLKKRLCLKISSQQISVPCIFPPFWEFRSWQDQLPLLPGEFNGRSVASKVDDGKGGQGKVEDGQC